MPIIVTSTAETESPLRLKFTASDVRRMMELGVLDSDGRYEVMEGEIVPVQAHSPPHIRIKRWLLRELTLRLGRDYWVDSEATFYLEDDGEFTLPDVVVYPQVLEGHLVRGPDLLLLIEVADTSIIKDRNRKARLYAEFGVPEYWVVNVAKRETIIFTHPGPGRYLKESRRPASEPLTPQALPQITLRLADVDA